MRRVIVAALLLVLAGCGTVQQKAGAPASKAAAQAANHSKAEPVLPAAGSGRGGYYLDDGPEEHPPAGLLDVPDAVVRAEPRSKYANRPYVVFGKTYTPLLNDAPFTQRGVASWYGKKFHGQRTSSGELYDMYKMTAAHPTLPIPSYARVTSLATGKQVIVRINDRGPFHSSRILDVSYTAALKLGLLGKGSHEVEIERLLPGEPVRTAALVLEQHTTEEARAETPVETTPAETTPAETRPAATKPTDGFYLQLGAYSHPERAAEVRARLLAAGTVEIVEVVPAGAVYRLYGGPFASRDAAQKAGRALPAALAIKPIVVRRSAD